MQVSRSSQHYATVNVDRSVETLPKRTEDETEPPGTPIPSRTRPQETHTAPGLSSWASPAFFQRSRASFGNLVDARIDPFAEEDGFVPGKGRKRPRFSMRGSEWRVLDEPASPGEKGSPVDWTEELEDESVEAEVGGEGTTEDIGAPQEVPKATEPLPTEQETPGDMAPESTTFEETAVSTNQPVPEINLGEEQPVEPELTKATEAVRQVNEKEDSADTVHLPIETPRLHPLPSPGLPVPSPLVSATSDQQGYFTSVTTAAQTQTPQHSTMTTQSHTTEIETNAVSELQSETSQVAEAPVPERMVEDPSASEFVAREAISPQSPDPAITTATAEPVTVVQTEEQEERVAAHDDGNVPAPSLDREVSVEKDVQVHDMHHSPKDIDMEEDEVEDVDAFSSDEQEDEDSDEKEDEKDLQQGEELDEENEPEGISSEEEEGEQKREREVEDDEDEEYGEKYRPGQIIDFHRNQVHEGPDKDKTHEYPEEATAEEPDSAHSQEEEEQGFYDEDDDGEPQDEEMYNEEEPEDEYASEYAYEDGDEDVVDSELESEEDRNEQPHQAHTSLKSAQPEIIVLDSDDENEPGETSQEHPPAVSKREPSEASVDGHESPDKMPAEEEADDWPSDEEEQMEDEIVADEESEGQEEHEGDYYQDDDKAENDEEVEDEWLADEERAEDNEVVEDRVEPVEDEVAEEDLASDVQEQGSSEDEQERYDQMNDQEEVEEEQRDEGQVGEQEHADITTPAEHETTARVDIDEEPPAGGYYEETHATENLPQPPDQASHESAAPVKHFSPPATAIDPALSQLESGEKDAIPDEKQERIEETSEGRIEEPPPADPEQRVNAGLYYDGAASPRVMHESTKGHEVTDSESRAVTPDEFREHDPSHQAISLNHTAIQETQEPPYQAEPAINGDKTLVDAQEEDILPTVENESRSRSLSILEQERYNVNENTAHEDLQLQIQATVDEAESIESQDEDHLHDGISEVSETYLQHPTAPDRHYPGLRSKLSYFAPLATLVDHFNTLVDTISVVSDTSPMTQSTSGKKDFAITLYLTDPSMAGTVLTAHLSRPYIEALPILEEGDAILLRNFHVKSSNHSMTLVGIETSAWAVFSGQDDNEEVQINGPPVEYGTEESSHAAHLRQWYREDGAVMVADNQLQASIEKASRDVTPLSSVAASDSASLDDSFGRDGGRRELNRSLRRGRKSHRRITIHELRDGRRYAEVGSPSDRESIHELRDGTVYANL